MPPKVLVAKDAATLVENLAVLLQSLLLNEGCHLPVVMIGLSAKECAKDYEKKLMEVSRDPRDSPDYDEARFDLVLLGLGPDGHTCSLFPGHPLLEEREKGVGAIEDSPKPPAKRITLTLPALGRAEHVVFVTTGHSKAPIIKEILTDESSKLPGALVKPASKKLVWVVDEPAMSLTGTGNYVKKEL